MWHAAAGPELPWLNASLPTSAPKSAPTQLSIAEQIST